MRRKDWIELAVWIAAFAVVIVSLSHAQTITGKFDVPASGATVPKRVGNFTIELPKHEHPELASKDHAHDDYATKADLAATIEQAVAEALAKLPPPAAPVTGPTAEELSEPGALQAYIDASLRKGRCTLPPGWIKTDKTINLERVHGGVIEGAGSPYHPSYDGGWSTSSRSIQGQTTIVATDPTQPVFDASFAVGLSLRDIGIETKGVGIDYYERHHGWGPTRLSLDRVTFRDCSIGLHCGRTPSDSMGSNATLRSCYFSRCAVGLQVNHNQGVIYNLDACKWDYGGDAVLMNGGGQVHMRDPSGYGMKRWLVIKQAGKNLGVSRITGLKSDRQKTDPLPIIVEAPPSGDVLVVVDGCNVTTNSETIPDDYRPFSGAVEVRLAQKFLLDQYRKQLPKE